MKKRSHSDGSESSKGNEICGDSNITDNDLSATVPLEIEPSDSSAPSEKGAKEGAKEGAEEGAKEGAEDIIGADIKRQYISFGQLVPFGLLMTTLIPLPEEHRLVSTYGKYWLSELQVTIPRTNSIHDNRHKVRYDETSVHPKYVGMLSAEGTALLTSILQRVNSGDFDCTLEHYCATNVHSGPYIPDNTSPYYSPDHFIGLNSFDNICICGITENLSAVKTGNVVFYDDTWAWSSKGVLYKLGEKHYADYFTKYFDQ